MDLNFSASDGRWAEGEKIVLLSEVLKRESRLRYCACSSGVFLYCLSPRLRSYRMEPSLK